MSYDYSIFRAPGPGPMSSWPAGDPPAMGSFEQLQVLIGRVHPEASWRRLGDTWWGRSSGRPEAAFELQVTPDEHGLCRFLTVRRITRSHVEELCRALDVVAVDNQTVELIRP